jgi:hypothetical protein
MGQQKAGTHVDSLAYTFFHSLPGRQSIKRGSRIYKTFKGITQRFLKRYRFFINLCVNRNQ